MITEYTYRVTATNPTLGTMELIFSSPGLPDVLVGARLPYSDETLGVVASSVVPSAYWESLGRQFSAIQVGVVATVQITAPTAQALPTVRNFTPGQTGLTSARTTPLQFMSLFTRAEQLAITAASLQSPEIRVWCDQLIAAGEVLATDPRIDAGLTTMVTAGLLTQSRKDTILPPSSGLTQA